MPQEFYYPVTAAAHDLPAGMGSPTNSSSRPGGGRSGPMTHDDGSTYNTLFANGSTGYYAFNLDWPGPMGTYDGVFTLGWRIGMLASSGGGSNNNDFLGFINAAATTGAERLQFTSTPASPSTGTYTTQGPSDVSAAATYRPGGGSWSQADFVNDQTIFAKVRYTDTGGGGNGTPRALTSIWGEISYTPPSGGFAFLLNLAGFGALPFVGAMDFSQFMRYLSWRRAHHPRHTLMRDRAEILRAWGEVKSHRHPTFFLPRFA